MLDENNLNSGYFLRSYLTDKHKKKLADKVAENDQRYEDMQVEAEGEDVLNGSLFENKVIESDDDSDDV